MLLYYNKEGKSRQMEEKILKEVLEIYEKLESNKLEVYFVGGCIRNLLMDLPVKDWDLTTNATPEQIMEIFPDSFYNNIFGTVGIPLDEKSIVEITTYRTEEGFSNKRHPDKVVWGQSIEEDLSRRDFTMNAIALKFDGDKQKIYVDPYDGRKDIKKRIIRTVGNPKERFKEDALRLMRAIRFASQLGFDIEDDTGKELKNDAKLIKEISAERIRDELLKIISSPNPEKGITLLKESGILQYILPELLEGVDVSQVRPGRHHTTDVYTHNLLSMKHCPSPDPIVKFAALLHDVGKPEVRGEDKDGLVTFYNHEIAGAKIAYEICQRLKFSKRDTHRITNLIRWHMFSVNENLSDAGIRRFIRRIGVENVADMMDLRIGDRLGGGTQTAESWRLIKFKERVAGELAPKPFSTNDLAIDGNDIMQELSLKPGPEVGKILQQLFEEVDEDMGKNNKDYLLKRIKEINDKN
jgi:tRNA nucleotidyltransferase (CCA-adding enzyme)